MSLTFGELKKNKRFWFDVIHLFILYKDLHTKITCLLLHLYYLLLEKTLPQLCHSKQKKRKKNLQESHAIPQEVILQQSSNDHLQLYMSQ